MSLADKIASAGEILAQQWEKDSRPVQPENELKPDNAGLAFRVTLLEHRVAALEALYNEQSRI